MKVHSTPSVYEFSENLKSCSFSEGNSCQDFLLVCENFIQGFNLESNLGCFFADMRYFLEYFFQAVFSVKKFFSKRSWF